ncbi:Uracil transporter [Empedobacter falsenii]|uniref:Uracil transporter n=1 Tax=Empedobacter falsenii TaxID=343874 RepID=A0A376G7H1_9FLAO|nr:Uracil transporter [Empedobacter falsenii]
MSQQNDQSIILAIDEKPKLGQGILLSIQHLFAMFGATVLVPALTGMSPAIALISSGIGTLVFILITRGKVPSYLGSSFAFINPIIAMKALEANPESGIATGSFLVGSFYSWSYLFIGRTLYSNGWNKMVNETFTSYCCWSSNYGNWSWISFYSNQNGNE